MPGFVIPVDNGGAATIRTKAKSELFTKRILINKNTPSSLKRTKFLTAILFYLIDLKKPIKFSISFLISALISLPCAISCLNLVIFIQSFP